MTMQQDDAQNHPAIYMQHCWYFSMCNPQQGDEFLNVTESPGQDDSENVIGALRYKK